MPKPSHLGCSKPNHAPAPRELAVRESGAALESVPPGKRRTFTAGEKLRIVRAADACTQRGEVEALLRREGIYSSLLSSWRKQFALHGSEGLAARKPGRKPKLDAKDRRIAELEKRAARAEAKLALAEKLIALQKKLRSYWAPSFPATRRADGPHRGHQRSDGAHRAGVRRPGGESRDIVPPDAAALAASGAQSCPEPAAGSPTTSDRRFSTCCIPSSWSTSRRPRGLRDTALAGYLSHPHLASIRTMYRLLAQRGETVERRAQRGPMKHAKPTLEATAPNQIWTWDITKLRGPLPGVFYLLYVIIDLFSRMVVGWMVAERENAAHAEQLFADALARHGIAPGVLTVHADRGSPMKSDGLAQLLGSLGVARSFSRPHVSDDNAFSEAQFKTLKYQPDYPDHFASPVHARGWCQQLFSWFCHLHQHSGLALFTPADVFYGRVDQVAARRQAALDGAYAAHPERFPNGPPVVRRPPAVVAINPMPFTANDVAEPATTRSQNAHHAAAQTPPHDALAAAAEAVPS